MAELFPEEFIDALANLRIRFPRVPGSGRPAEHRSRDLGPGIEFCDFRSYAPGDDFRRVDWNLYRRSGRLFLKLFEEMEDLPLYVLLDTSDSMFFEDPPRADAARRMAAVMAVVGLGRHDRLGLHPFGADLLPSMEGVTGRQSLGRVLRFLERLEGAGETDMEASLLRFAAGRRRSGLAVVISDFFDAGGIDRVTAALASLRHRLCLVQVVRGSDKDPALQGERRFLDCETGARVDVSLTPEVKARYRRAYRTFCEDLLDFVARRRGSLFMLDADRPVLQQLDVLFPGGELAV